MAGLNREIGEFVPELGKFYRIAPVGEFVGSPYWEIALQHAADTFAKAKGTREAVRIELGDILIQQYPLLNKMVFFFVHMVNGKEMFTHYEFELTPDGVDFLRARGMWPDTMLPSVN